jgi:hypothetical protein
MGALIFVLWSIFGIVYLLIAAASRFQQNTGQDHASIIMALSMDGSVWAVTVFVSSLIGVGLVWIAVKLKKGLAPSEYLSLKPLAPKTIFALLGISLALCVLSDLTSYLLGKPIVPEVMITTYSTCLYPWVFWVGIVLLGPVFEEFFFRGFLFEGLRQSKMGNVGAALLTAAAWASLHVQYELYIIVTIFVLGLLYAYIRLKTGSIWSCIMIHQVMSCVAMIETVLKINGHMPVN